MKHNFKRLFLEYGSLKFIEIKGAKTDVVFFLERTGEPCVTSARAAANEATHVRACLEQILMEWVRLLYYNMRDFCNLIGLLTRPYFNLQVVFRVREEKKQIYVCLFFIFVFQESFPSTLASVDPRLFQERPNTEMYGWPDPWLTGFRPNQMGFQPISPGDRPPMGNST